MPFAGPDKIPSINISEEVRCDAWKPYDASSDARPFFSSLPFLAQEKLNLNVCDNGYQAVSGISSDFRMLHQDGKGSDLPEDFDTYRIGTVLLDDEEELLAGRMDDFDLSGLPGSLEDLEEYDHFGSGGCMELETDLQESLGVGMSKFSLIILVAIGCPIILFLMVWKPLLENIQLGTILLEHHLFEILTAMCRILN